MGLTDLNKKKSNNVAVSEKKANFNPAIINRIFGFMFFPVALPRKGCFGYNIFRPLYR